MSMTDLFAQTAPDRTDAPEAPSFEDFWEMTPKSGSKKKAEDKYRSFSAQNRALAAKHVADYYKWWSQAYPKASTLHVTTYLNGHRWGDDDWKPQKAPAQGDKMQMYADTIKKGKAFLCKGYSAALARELIDRGYVTEAECKAVRIL